MATRIEWFREFVRNLDKKAHYEDAKDLALKAVRRRFGPQSSLLASEDRLLSGGFQHRPVNFNIDNFKSLFADLLVHESRRLLHPLFHGRLVSATNFVCFTRRTIGLVIGSRHRTRTLLEHITGSRLQAFIVDKEYDVMRIDSDSEEQLEITKTCVLAIAFRYTSYDYLLDASIRYDDCDTSYHVRCGTPLSDYNFISAFVVHDDKHKLLRVKSLPQRMDTQLCL